MAICNRDLDQSEKVKTLDFKEWAVATGATLFVGLIPYPAKLHKWQFSGVGLSGAPVYNLVIQRWTSAGVTSITPGSAVTLAGAFGLSGALIGSTFNSGSSLSQLQAGDALLVVSTGANTAVTQLIGSVILEATQDIKTSYSVP